jgi:hypothetical protein
LPVPGAPDTWYAAGDAQRSCLRAAMADARLSRAGAA